MRVAIISCFETYQNRVDDMEKYYKSQKNDVTIIQSNYLHFDKTKRKNQNEPNTIMIDVPTYKKNLSIKRIYSHFSFSKICLKYLNSQEFDLVHVLIPPNSLCSELSKLEYSPKLIFDVIDYWPETLPTKKISKTFVYKKWQMMRNKYILNADYIITECKLFENELRKSLNIKKIKTIYFARNKIQNRSTIIKTNSNEIELVYLGSINNIIDIEYIVNILNEVNKLIKVKFHLIGDGENKNIFLELLKKMGINYIDHGKVYGVKEKQAIFNKCSFGLNIMKENVFVGLTMKSIDYFQFGLPIINNISHDSNNLVKKYDIGINTNEFSNIEILARNIVLKSEEKKNNLIRKNVENMFKEVFLFETLANSMSKIMEEIDEGLN